VPDKIVLAKGFNYKEILDTLPDNAVRMAVKECDTKGKLSFGAFSVGAEGHRYQVVLDYISVDSTNVRFLIDFENDPISHVERMKEPDNPLEVERSSITPCVTGIYLPIRTGTEELVN
jgi:hypothetical protein